MITDTTGQAELAISRTTIAIEGLPGTRKVLQITDSHLGEADSRDESGVIAAAEHCRQAFGGAAITHWEAALRRSRDWQADCTVFTGDIVHFPSVRNIELLGQAFRSLESPYLYTLGNHDWLLPHQEPSDELRTAAYPLFGHLTSGSPSCQKLDLGGVYLIALDNSNYQIDERQLEFVKQQLSDSTPTILFLHIPIYLSSLEQKTLTVWGAPIMMNAPGWNKEERQQWGIRDTDLPTRELHRMITEGDFPNLAAIFCGHLHFAHRAAFFDGRYQYVTEAGFSGGYREIVLTPL